VRELSLFTGAGGGLLAGRLLGWEPIGYVEINDYCQRVLARRIAEGYLPPAPIFTDLREFVLSGAADEYRGFADVVTGGFPCQDISSAGKGAGLDGERSSLWFAMAAVVRVVRPRYVFVENSAALTVRGLGRVLGSLAELGLDAAWGVYAAADVGAPHLRRRVWIVGHAHGDGESASALDAGQVAELPRAAADAHREHLWQQSRRRRGACRSTGAAEFGADGEPGSLADAAGERGHKGLCGAAKIAGTTDALARGALCADAHGAGLEKRESVGGDEGEKFSAVVRARWWAAEPAVGRVANGLADRVEQLRAIGNGQVPAVAALAWRELSAVLAARPEGPRCF
jgi:DNA (cytosine-5)-methyltransferase 1